MKNNIRKINFNAGPAALPDEVLKQAAAAVLEFNNTGISILELPHRGKEFPAIVEEGTYLVRELCKLDNNYEVLWLHGGGRLQFSMIPMNFLPQNGKAGYIESGYWAEESIKYAGYYGNVEVIASSKNVQYNRLPDLPEIIPGDISYLHITTNNTVFGTQWHSMPKASVPIIADMSSDIFSYKRDYSRFALFYAAAQKNLGIPGVGLVVIRKDMLKKQVRPLPPMMDFKENVREKSVLNTANVFGVYVSLLMLRWIKAKGMDDIETENRHKAKLLYDAIDESKSFITYVKEKSHRSITNVCFLARKPETEKVFNALCKENNITGVQGHRSMGGYRASLYNAVTIESVQKLVDIIKVMA